MARTKRRKKRTHVPEPDKPTGPRTFVFWRGRYGPIMKPLESDLRRMLAPSTASRLRESANNSLRDFVDLAGPLGVTHFLILTATPGAAYLRIARAPRGPTVAFRIANYSLAKDVLASLARPRAPDGAFRSPPLVVLNNFGGGAAAGAASLESLAGDDAAAAAAAAAVGGGSRDAALSLAAALWRGAFPAIDVRTAKLAACQRVVLLSHAGDGRVSLRHYTISARPSGVSPALRDLVARRALPASLGDVADAADALLRDGGAGSESEGEDNRVTLGGGGLRRAGADGGAARVRLHEVGPRLDMDLVKVEAGLCGGAVLYHVHERRTAATAAATAARVASREAERAARRRQQDANVKRKATAAAAKADAKKAKAQGGSGAARPPPTGTRWWEAADPDAAPPSDDDDVAAYRDAVGADPESLAGLTGRGGGGRGGRGRGRGGRGGGRGRGRRG